MTLPPDVVHIIAALNAAGFEAFAVGGCVRDALSGAIPSDWDVTTSALPEDVMRVFAGHRLIETGLKHGTVTLVLNGNSYEVTTYRIDGAYSDNRRPDSVTFTRSLCEDLRRRDFTINAMAYADRLIDPFGGEDDLKNKLIRCVGDPDRRFNEDGLRIMRALRFASALDFTIERDTDRSLRQNIGLLRNIAAERIRDELVRLLLGPGVYRVLTGYKDELCFLLPECLMGSSSWEERTAAVANAERDVYVRLVLLFGDSAASVMERLRFSSKEIKETSALAAHMDTEIKNVRRLLSELGRDTFFRLIAVKKAIARSAQALFGEICRLEELSAEAGRLIEEGACLNLAALAVDGRDLISIGIQPGRRLGEMLEMLLSLVIDEGFPNDRDTLLKIAREMSGN